MDTNEAADQAGNKPHNHCDGCHVNLVKGCVSVALRVLEDEIHLCAKWQRPSLHTVLPLHVKHQTGKAGQNKTDLSHCADDRDSQGKMLQGRHDCWQEQMLTKAGYTRSHTTLPKPPKSTAHCMPVWSSVRR